METELYKTITDKVLETGLSKRKFASKFNIPRVWLMDFLNPSTDFRPLQVKTQSILIKNLDIPYEILKDYNEWVRMKRGK